jgi:polyhydroxyalkanoate synthesis regulator phasin
MKNSRKIISILIVASMSIGLFVGCSSKTAATSATANTGSGNTRKFDPAAMKTNYENVLKTLVTAGTITQAQSDKVLEAVTKATPKSGDQGTNQSGDKNSQVKTNGTGNTQNRTRNNPLSALVTSGVITQAQADAINQKIRENMKNSQSSQSSQSK